jgi:hypothetical protein
MASLIDDGSRLDSEVICCNFGVVVMGTQSILVMYHLFSFINNSRLNSWL